MSNTLDVHVNVEITAETLQSIVENAKQILGANERGFYQIDTAEMVSQMVSQFLLEKDFESYVKDIKNYPSKAADQHSR